MEIFKIEDITYFYPEGEKPAISNVSLSVGEGEFLLVVGPSGGGKTTLARVMAGLIPDFYGGRIKGEISFRGIPASRLGRKELQKNVGMIFQNPERQLIMDKVESEIAFGLENSGIEPGEIKRRIMETAGFLGFSGLLGARSQDLSGGEKQRLIFASMLAMRPKVIVLDEPTSQLDPIAAEEVFQTLRRLKDDLGYTIILIEQSLDRCFHLADRVLLLEGGNIVRDASSANFTKWAAEKKSDFIPLVCKLFSAGELEELPLTVGKARKLLRNYSKPEKEIKKKNSYSEDKNPVIKIKSVSYTYENGVTALKNINLTVRENDFLCIAGENGAGKSTLLKIVSGILRPLSGKVVVLEKELRVLSNSDRARLLGYLSQDPNDYLFNDSVEKELNYTLNNLAQRDDGVIEELLNLLEISRHRHKNPRDLSTGERQRVALASVMAARPPILLLDEPTRGLNCRLKAQLGRILHSFIKQNNGTVILVSQDIEFATEFAGRIALLFKGEIAGDGNKYDVLKGDIYYSSQMSRLFCGISDEVLTLKDAREWIKA